jgi:hypothetical protein
MQIFQFTIKIIIPNICFSCKKCVSASFVLQHDAEKSEYWNHRSVTKVSTSMACKNMLLQQQIHTQKSVHVKAIQRRPVRPTDHPINGIESEVIKHKILERVPVVGGHYQATST